MSSQTSKIVLVISCAITGGTIGYVHFKQQADREKMHEGVIKDTERQQKRKIENIYLLQQQKDLTKHLKKDMENS